MKKSTVISSIISAAMIASSSVAAIYASAVNIAPAAAPAPAVQCTTVPAEIYDFICPEPTTATSSPALNRLPAVYQHPI